MQLNREIIRFDHGNGFLNGNHKSWILNDGTCTTKFFCISKKQKNLAIKFFKKINYPLLENKINFDSYDNTKKNNNIKNTTLNFKKNINIIYFTKNFEHERSPGPIAFNDIDYLNIRQVIFNKIKKHNNNFIFQPHPDNKLKMKNIFFDNKELKRFNPKIIPNFVGFFDCSVSSVFWETINAGQPVVLFKFYTVDKLSPLNELIKKRCEIIEINNTKNFENFINKIDLKKIINKAIVKAKKFKNNEIKLNYK